MRHLGLYLFRQLTSAFLFAGTAVTFVVLFTQLFRLLSLVIDNSATMWVFFRMLSLSIPTFLPLVLPLGLGIATLFIYHKLAIDSELVVMSSAGISPFRLAKPALVLGVIVCFVCFILTLWITPQANRDLINLQYKVRDSYAVFLSRPGSFNDITDGLTFYAHRRGSGGALEGILIHDVRHPEVPITIMAENGQVTDNNGQPQIVVFNGRRQEMDLSTGKLSELVFEQYVLDLDALRAAAAPRAPDPREQTIGELINPSAELTSQQGSHEHLLAELNQRLASPLLTLCYVMIGLTAILAGEFNRRGMSKRILIASLAIIIVQAIFMSLNSAIVRHPWFAVALYLTALLPAFICFLLLTSENFKAAVLSPPSSRTAS